MVVLIVILLLDLAAVVGFCGGFVRPGCRRGVSECRVGDGGGGGEGGGGRGWGREVRGRVGENVVAEAARRGSNARAGRGWIGGVGSKWLSVGGRVAPGSLLGCVWVLTTH